MKHFEVHSGYRQFYVADSGLAPLAPEDWTDRHIKQRHNTLKNITALCSEGDVTARIISCGPEDQEPSLDGSRDFEVETVIQVESGKIGVFEWPFELQDEYVVAPGTYQIIFRGYDLAKVSSEEDFYVVLIRKKKESD